MKRSRKKNGLVLVTSLLVVAISVMMMGAGLSLSQTSLNLQGSSEDVHAAHEAAQAGLAYARTRLQATPGWRGFEAGQPDLVTVNIPGKLWVREHQGNVLGILTDPSGRVSSFRIRFNYQDNSLTNDALPDPVAAMRFNMPYVSENNLDSAQSKQVYRAIPSGGTYKVIVGSSPTPFDTGRYAAALLCEGASGDGLVQLSPSNLNPLNSNRRVSRKVVEAIFTRDLSKIGDAAVNGAMNLDFALKTSGRMVVESKDPGVPPRARTMESMNVTVPVAGATPVSFGSSGEVYVKPATGTFKVNNTDSTAPAAQQEDSSSRIPSIKWSEVPKASPTGAKMAAGTYVWRENPRRLEYFDQEFNGTIPPLGTPPTAIHTNGSSLDGGAGAIDMNRAEMALDISENVYVQPTAGGVTGLAVVAEPSLITLLRNRPDVRMAPAGSDPAPVLTSSGGILISGELSGKGSVTAEGNITFQGSSVLEADANGKMAVYSKGDILLDRIPPAIAGGGTQVTILLGDEHSGSGSGGPAPAPITAFLQGGTPPFGTPSYQDIGFAGLFYAMGNVTTKLGERAATDPGGAASAADLYFRGVVVAYGGNPEMNHSPGATAGKGAINMQGGNVHMVYDSSYVVHTINFLVPAKLDLTSYQTY